MGVLFDVNVWLPLVWNGHIQCKAKKILALFSFIVFGFQLRASDTVYQDSPVGLTVDVVSLMKPYEKLAKESLYRFEKSFKKKKGRTFYLVTRIYEDEYYEQVFVLVKKQKEGLYVGTIASKPMGRVSFRAGDRITLESKDIFDWLIVNKDGTEEGNFQGKAMDLLQVGGASFISSWHPVDGHYEIFEVVSVRNPRTQQEIMEIVPEDVIERVEAYVTKTVGGRVSADGKVKYGFTLVSFPNWEIIDKKE